MLTYEIAVHNYQWQSNLVPDNSKSSVKVANLFPIYSSTNKPHTLFLEVPVWFYEVVSYFSSLSPRYSHYFLQNNNFFMNTLQT